MSPNAEKIIFVMDNLNTHKPASLYSRTGETYTFTGFPAKKLQGWLEQLGVQKL